MLKCKGLFAVSLPSHSHLVMAARLAPQNTAWGSKIWEKSGQNTHQETLWDQPPPRATGLGSTGSPQAPGWSFILSSTLWPTPLPSSQH